MKKKHKYYWLSWANYSRDSWSFSDTVTVDEHPFTTVRLENDNCGLWVLLSWKEITLDEYKLHGEHIPI